jgi:transcription initiation factor TFIIIB Brf1 subunit/transcription initiation factor TFIIB
MVSTVLMPAQNLVLKSGKKSSKDKINSSPVNIKNYVNYFQKELGLDNKSADSSNILNDSYSLVS